MVEEKEVEGSKVGAGAWAIPIPDGAEFGGIPEGTYMIRCIEEPKESLSSKGDPQTEFTFVVADLDHPEYDEREAHYWCSRKPKAWWNITSTLEALGVPYEIDKVNKVFRFDPMECLGKVAKGVWEIQKYQGRERSRLVRVISVEEEVETLGGDSEPGDLPF